MPPSAAPPADAALRLQQMTLERDFAQAALTNVSRPDAALREARLAWAEVTRLDDLGCTNGYDSDEMDAARDRLDAALAPSAPPSPADGAPEVEG